MTNFTTDQISCDTEQTEERKFSDLETEVEHAEIGASATSDVLPENECRHVQSRMIKLFRGYQFIPNDYCPKCGVKL